MTTGEGVTVKLQLPPTATVLRVKQEVESELGIRPREAIVFSGNTAHTEKLPDEETLDSLLVGDGPRPRRTASQFNCPSGGTARSATLPGGTKKEQKYPRAAPHSWAKAHLVQEGAYQNFGSTE